MGVSIHGDAYRIIDLLEYMEAWVAKNGGYRDDALKVEDFLYKVADDFGVVLDDWFVTVYNEYYEDYNPESNFFSAVQTYYFPEVDWDEYDYGDEHQEFWPNGNFRKYFGGGANSSEILEAHFEDEFGYEGKFSDYEQ
jgi:hypothetical protein